MTRDRLALDRLALFLNDARRRRLDRRQLVRRAMALGISLPTLSALLVEQTSARQATPAATPWSGGPPVAERRPETREFSGVEIEDPYAWLENPDDPEVIAYLEAENAYRESVIAPTAALQETLYTEMVGRINQTDSSAPIPFDGNFYYARTEEGLQYEIICRKQGSLDAPEEVLLDLNEMVGESGYIALGFYRPNPNQRYLAYTINEDGGIEYTLSIKDLETGELLTEQLPNTDTLEWASDDTFFYTRQDETLRSAELYRHTLGEDPAADPLLYREDDETFYLYAYKSDSRRFIFALSISPITSEVRYLPADTPEAEWRVFAPRQTDVIYSLEHHDEDFLVLTNQEAINFKLMAAPVADPAPEGWRELVPHREEALLENLDVFEQYLVLYGREDGFTQIWVREVASGETRPIAFPEPVFTATAADNWEYDTTKLRYDYTSLVTPPSTFEYDMATGEQTLLKQQEIIGGHDPDQYVSERLFATAEDGTEVPISLVYRRDAPAGPRPLRLDGYGAYGITSDPVFSVLRLTLINRGLTYAIAHVRGGQELGRLWYEDGKLLHKQNTFTDFIACAEHLSAEGYTAPDRLLAMGGSAGGMLMGAVANMRPDLFRVIVANVPFVDVLRTMLDPSLPLTTGEFDEWGNPTNPEFFDYIQAYSPYDNVTAQDYPSLLITGGIDDDQVPYWQPAKWTAKLRYLKTDDNLLLLRMNMGAGHGGASGRYDFWREVAHDYAVMLLMLDLEDVEPLATPLASPVAARRETGPRAAALAAAPLAGLNRAFRPGQATTVRHAAAGER